MEHVSNPPRVRASQSRAAAAFLVAFALGLGALQSVIWHGPESPLVASAITRALHPGLLAKPAQSTLAAPHGDYFAFGRMSAPLHLLLLLALHARLSSAPALSPATRSGILWVATVALIGDLTTYWLSELLGAGVRHVGFWYVQVPALAATTMWVSAVGLRARRPELTALRWAVPCALAGTVLLQYMPHGPLMGLGAALLWPSKRRGPP